MRPFRAATRFAFIVLSIAAVPLQSQPVSTVSVMINTINNKGCWDRAGAICEKPDMMARVLLRQPDGTDVLCGFTTPVANFDNLGPGDPRLSACVGRPVQTPFDLVLSLYDVDEHQLPDKSIIQEQIWLSSTPPGDLIIPFRQLAPGVPTQIHGPHADMNFTITITPALPAFEHQKLALSSLTFLPQFGDRVFASNTIVLPTGPGTSTTYPATARMSFAVRQGIGPATTIASVVVNGSFNLDWDGKINGQLAPPGTYTLQATLTDGGAVSSADVTIPNAAGVFKISDPVDAHRWNPRAGPLNFPYVLNPGGTITTRVEGPALAGSACGAGPLPIAAPNRSTTVFAGSGLLPVEMRNGGFAFLPTGNYCVHFEARSASGVLFGSDIREIDLDNAPPLRLVVALHPGVPALLPSVLLSPGSSVLVPSATLYVEARAFNDQRKPRPTGRITVRAMPLFPLVAPPLISTAICAGTSVCRLFVSPATLAAAGGTPTSPGVLAFDAFATDLSNVTGADDAATMQVALRATELTAPSPTRPIMESVPLAGNERMGITVLPRNQTLDVAFHAGTGIDLSDPLQVALFSETIENILNLFEGGDDKVGDTSVMPLDGSPGRFAFWISRTPAEVSVYAEECRRSHFEPLPVAEMQAIIHRVNCRDSADDNGATFSAEFGGGVERIFWHEFHHAAFDLADEYPPDGGYWQEHDYPNVMSDATQCAVYGAEPTRCEQIGTTGWWRAAPMPDVMAGDKTGENLDERRRANLVLTRCKGGGC